MKRKQSLTRKRKTGPRKSPARKAVRKKTASRKKAATRKSTTRKTTSHTAAPRRKTVARRKKPATARKRLATRRKTKQAAQMPGWLRLAGSLAYKVSFLCFLGVIAGIIGLYHYSRDLPSISLLDQQTRSPQVTIVDRHNVLITNYGDLHGKPVEISELPPHVVQAFLATEDRNFYHHLGVNPVAVLRALIINLKSGHVRQGGSTITQQFAKNVFLSPEKTIKRKVQEILLAVQLEREFSKDEILGMYLNNVYFGAGTYGLRAATDRYFAKAPAQLSVGEAAMLAGLLKAPSKYSPAARPDAARERARVVLQAMVEEDYLSRERMEKILAEGVARISIHKNLGPYVTDKVMRELRQELGDIKQDVVVHTTIDLAAHQKVEAAIKTLPERDTRFTDDIQVGLVAMEADGAIRLLIGGRDYAASEYNRVTQSKRQPGSAFKPFVYLAALEAGWQPTDQILDAPLELEGWMPANYKDKYYGPVSITEAMARSLNAAAIRVQEEAGRRSVVSLARRVGFENKIDPGAALALGVNETTPLELASAYGPFANNGMKVTPYTITSVYTTGGKVLFAQEKNDAVRVIDEAPLIAINHMLRQVVEAGSGRAASLPGYRAAGKTGTTQDSRDAWFAGHASGLTGVVWLGKDDYTPMKEGWSPISGSGAPAVLWRDMMLATLDGRAPETIIEWAPPQRRPSIFDHFRNLLISDDAQNTGPYEGEIAPDEQAFAWAAEEEAPLVSQDAPRDIARQQSTQQSAQHSAQQTTKNEPPKAEIAQTQSMDALLAEVMAVPIEKQLPTNDVDAFLEQRESWAEEGGPALSVSQAALEAGGGSASPPNP